MGRPRKNEDIGKPWVVRDVPEHVKRKVRVYAAQHDMTMAQAVEALVEGRYGSEEDRALLQALIKVYGRVIVEDMPGAQTEAKQVTGVLEQRRLEGRLDPSLALPAPERSLSEDTSSLTVEELTPSHVVDEYCKALYFEEDYMAAAAYLADCHRLRAARTLEDAAAALRHQTQDEGHRYNELSGAQEPLYESPDRCYVGISLKSRDPEPVVSPSKPQHVHFTLVRANGHWGIIAANESLPRWLWKQMDEQRHESVESIRKDRGES